MPPCPLGSATLRVSSPDRSPSLYLPPSQVSHTFSNYPPGVRYIWFQHGGVDTHYWAGWYGPRVTNSSITIGPPRCPDAPEAPSAEP